MRRFAVCMNWKMKRAQVQQVDWISIQKIERKSRDHSTAHFPSAAIARTDEFYERFWRIPRILNQIIVEDCLTHVSSQPEMIPSPRALLTQPRQKIAA